jgi:hypothetical protein
VTFAEFAPLYETNGLRAYAAGGIGNNDSWFDEVSATLLHDRVSLGVGQFHTETEGVRADNDLEHDILAAQGTIQLSRSLSAFGQYIYRDTRAGDRRLRFDLDGDVLPALDTGLERQIGRIGLNYTPDPKLTLLALAHYSETEIDVSDAFTDTFDFPPFPPFVLDNQLATDADADALNGQLQATRRGLSLFGARDLTLTVGGSAGRSDVDQRNTLDLTINGVPIPTIETPNDSDLEEYAGYVYATSRPSSRLTLTAGLGYATMDQGGGGPFKRDRALPKLGVVFDAAPGVTLRAAYAQSMTMADADGDRLEPDQIAGFRQIEDGPLGAVTELLGAGVDLRLGDGWLAGAEAVWRDQDLDFDDRPDIDRINRRDIGGYVGRTFGRRWAVSAGLRYQRLASEFPTDLEYLRTWSAPVAVTWFDPSGLFARGVVTFVDQEIQDPGAADPTRRNDNFAVVDATVGFRIPGAPAAITLEARNLFDTDFGFETRPLLDLPGVVDQVAPPLLARERTIMLRGVVSF